MPDGVFNVVPGFGHTAGKALALHMDVDCIAFTGSTAHRQADAAVRGAVEHEARVARVRRQVAEHRARGLPGPRSGGRRRRRRRSSSTRARCARRARACSCRSRSRTRCSRRSRQSARRMVARRPARSGDAARRDRRRDADERACSATSTPAETEGATSALGGNRVRAGQRRLLRRADGVRRRAART